VVWHPLEEMTEAGAVKFYVDAEAVLERLPRLGVPLILKARRRDGAVGSYRPNHMAKLVRKLADKFGMPATFTLDACRHGGMTELEEAELTTGQGRAGQGRAGQGRAGQGRAGQGRAGQGRAGQGTIWPSNRPSLFRVCQGDDGARPGGHPEASRPSAGERKQHIRSEWPEEYDSERKREQ
jgi:hypothetical protein